MSTGAMRSVRMTSGEDTTSLSNRASLRLKSQNLSALDSRQREAHEQRRCHTEGRCEFWYCRSAPMTFCSIPHG